MNFFTILENAAAKIVEWIALFLLSPVFPFFLGAVVLVVLFLILRAIYLALRDRNLPNISYTREFSEPCVYAGDEVELIETICNRGFFPLFRVDMEAYLYNELRLTGYEPPKKDGMQYFVSRFTLWPYMRIRRRHKVVCLQRGYYSLQSAVVYKRDGEQFFECPAQIHVFPRPIPLDTVIEASGRMQGDERAVRPLFSDPFSISGVRDYRFGDTVSQINFKVSARTWMASGASSSPLKVNDREFCANRRLAVFMDFHLERDCGIDGGAYQKRTEAGLSYASALIREGIYGGFNVGFFSNCRGEDGSQAIRFPLAGGENHMLDIFRAFAELRPADGVSFPALLDEMIETGEGDCEIMILLFCPSSETDSRINELRRLGNSVRVIILSPEDEENSGR